MSSGDGGGGETTFVCCFVVLFVRGVFSFGTFCITTLLVWVSSWCDFVVFSGMLDLV